MARIYKSARGKSVDMDKIKLANETATAVGNMRVNARGDLIGAGGRISQGRNQIMDQVYAVPSPMYSPNDPSVRAEQKAIKEASKAKELHDLANTLAVPSAPESVAPEVPEEPAPTAPARGSLASSLAKKVSVKQEPTPDPRTPKGPTRI
jgi:hypothetical protein